MADPKPTVAICIRVPVEIRQRIKEMCQERDIPMTTLLESLVNEEYERNEE